MWEVGMPAEVMMVLGGKGKVKTTNWSPMSRVSNAEVQ